MSQDALDAARDLEDLLDRENGLLRANDFAAAGRLAERKEALMSRLNLATIAAPAVLSDATFQAIGQRLRQLVQENRKLLQMAMQVQLRLVKLVATAPRTTGVIYTRSGGVLEEPLPHGMTFYTRA